MGMRSTQSYVPGTMRVFALFAVLPGGRGEAPTEGQYSDVVLTEFFARMTVNRVG